MNLGDLYAEKAISQIPRILSMLDRNEYSPSYGCFDRIYWLDKEIDFPSSILQLNADNLALVYTYPYPMNPYFKKEKIKKWIFAAIDYWTVIQHKDGSFDEFYPNEHGWAGPTGFLLFSMLDIYFRLGGEMPRELKDTLLEASDRAANYLAKYDEIGILANHHAMALLPIYYTYNVLKDESLLQSFYEKFEVLEGLQSSEGWLLEYDGADPGYLSATVSFLGRIYKLTDDQNLRSRILNIVEKAIEFSSYFVYPNRFYGGTIGSRQTLHFYPHGYEIFDDQFPLARRIADTMLMGMAEGKLVLPEIMPWRYLGYRVQEYLLSYLDYEPQDTGDSLKLPHEKPPFIRFFEEAGILAVKKPNYYLVANLAKGGVVKVFSQDGELIYNDCGMIGKLSNGKVVTSQWIDKSHRVKLLEGQILVEGGMHFAPFKLPTPLKMIAFRSGLLALGWNTQLSYWMKGAIRRLFITDAKKSPVIFRRMISFGDDNIQIDDVIEFHSSGEFLSLRIGDEFSVRYVPQSLYYQSQEVGVDGFDVSQKSLSILNNAKKATFRRSIQPSSKHVEFLEYFDRSIDS